MPCGRTVRLLLAFASLVLLWLLDFLPLTMVAFAHVCLLDLGGVSGSESHVRRILPRDKPLYAREFQEGA
jgi:hypothetical protein